MVTSVVRNPVISRNITESQRLEQTLMTIRSAKEKIPNSYVVVLEGGTENKDDCEAMLMAGADYVFSYDLVKNGKRLQNANRSKSYGEMTLMLEYFQSENFRIAKEESLSLIKLSGRYILNEKYKFNEDDKCVIKYDHVVWSGEGACSTRYWQIPTSKYEHFALRLGILYQNFDQIIDLEHGFYYFNVVPREGLIEGVEVGVSGFVEGIGKWETA